MRTTTMTLAELYLKIGLRTRLTNLPKETKVVVVMDSAKYHCRFIEKAPWTKIAVVSKDDIEIPNQILTKSVLLEKILIILKDIEKQYVIDSMTEKASYSVLQLPAYHCILNPIELAWNQSKYHVCHLNLYTSKPSKLVDLIRFVCKENVSTEKKGLENPGVPLDSMFTLHRFDNYLLFANKFKINWFSI